MITIYHLITKEIKGSLSFNKIVRDVKSGKLFGALEADISINPKFIDKFKEFPHFFCTCNVKTNDIGEHMQEYFMHNDMKFFHKRLLINRLKAQKILIAQVFYRYSHPV